MSSLLPLGLREQMAYNRRASQAEREGLLDSILPSPTHPRAKPRALATCSLAIFLLLVVWMASTSIAQSEKEEKSIWAPSMQRWVWESGVEMGNKDDTQLQGQAKQSSIEEDEDGSEANEVDEEDEEAETVMKSGLAKYIWHEDLEWDADGSGRLIVVGDVHGMYDELKSFLRELEYSPDQTRHHNDTLVFVGDLVAKHPDIKSSLKTVDYIRSLNASAVRGNHDQDVLNWRAWMEATSLEGLGTEEAEGTVTSSDSVEEDDENRRRSREDAVPDNVPQVLKHKWRDEHFKIAKSMSKESADWLKRRSMTLHIRSLHTYIVHAGLLPWTIPKNKKGKSNKKVHTQDNEDDGTSADFLKDLDFSNEFGITSETSLLESSDETSFVPVTASSVSDTTSKNKSNKNKNKKTLDPEIAILTVPLNRKPFTLLEMRGLLKNGSKVTKSSKKGIPWAPIWNQVMKGCQQTIVADQNNGDHLNFEEEKMKPGQCRPLSVIYGHAAARGLDLHPYSFGLDSGAVYGRSFSALVVNGKEWKGGKDNNSSGNKHKKEVISSSSGSSSSNGEVSDNRHESKRGAGDKLKSKKLESVDVAIAGRYARVYSMKTKKP